MNFVSLIRSDYSATSASLIVDFTFCKRDASKFSLGIRSRLGSGLGLELLEKIFRAPVYNALRGHLCDSTAFLFLTSYLAKIDKCYLLPSRYSCSSNHCEDYFLTYIKEILFQLT